MPSLTTTGAWRSLSRASWLRRSTPTGRLCRSSPATPPPISTGALRSLSRASPPRRSSTTGRPCNSNLTLPKPTPTGAWRSLIRVSWPRRSTTTDWPYRSSLTLPNSTSSGVLRSLTGAGWPRRSNTTGRPCTSSLTTPQPSPACSMFSGGSARARRTRPRAARAKKRSRWTRSSRTSHATGDRAGPRARPGLGRAGAGALHRPQALRAVRTHAGQDHADRVGPGGGSGRSEKHVDRRPVSIDRRTALQRHAVTSAVAMDAYVEIARRDQRMTRPDAIAVPRLLDPDGSELVTVLGEGPREPFGHVLDDDEPGSVRRHRHEELADGLGPTGRCPDRDHALRRRRGRRPLGRGRLWLRPCRHGHGPWAPTGDGLHRVEHLRNHLRHPSHQLPRGQPHDTHRAQVEGERSHLTRRLRRWGHEDDRRLRGAHEPFQRAESPFRQDGHIEGDHVGLEPRDRLARVVQVRHRSRDFDLEIRRQDGGENASCHRRTLDDEDADLPFHGSKSRTSPTRGGACASARRCACSSVRSCRRAQSRSRRT